MSVLFSDYVKNIFSFFHLGHITNYFVIVGSMPDGKTFKEIIVLSLLFVNVVVSMQSFRLSFSLSLSFDLFVMKIKVSKEKMK